MSDKRIGIIVPHIVTNVDRELLSGIFDVMKIYNYDLVIITGISNFTDPDGVYADGATNIYELISHADLSGFIFAADWIVKLDLKQRIYDLLAERGLPCVVIEENKPCFPSIFPEQRESTRALTEHLIKEHGCRKLYFLAGFEGHIASDERLAGFRKALEDNDLPFDEGNVFYGDFWTEKPRILAEKIASGEIEMPDAVVCACDSMAVSLINGLAENGIRVPQDIKVTGNDGKIESLLCQPTLTTICGRNRLLGQHTAEMICRMIEPELPAKNFASCKEKIAFRESCGCIGASELSADVIAEIRRPFSFQTERYIAMTTDFIDKLVGKDSPEELMFMASAYSYRLPNWKGLAICLCEDWKFDFSDTSKFRKSGFSDNVTIALETDKIYGFCNICKEEIPASKLIPDSITEEVPKVWLLTSLHCRGQIFGYICTGYYDTDDIYLDENYCTWCDTISKGLSETESRLYQKYIREQINSSFDHDPATGLYSRRGLKSRVSENAEKFSNFVLIALTFDTDSDTGNGLDFESMLAVSIKRTADEAELSAHISANEFIILLSNHEDIPPNRLMLERLDSIENDLYHYTTSQVHIETPDISAASEIISDTAELDTLIDRTLSASKRCLHPSNNNNMSCLLDLRRRIRRNPEFEWNVADISNELHISRSHFQRLFTELFGRSFTEYMIDSRLEKAKQLLVHSNLNVSEVAYACGYNNISHFMRQFKAKCGVTALKFRNSK